MAYCLANNRHTLVSRSVEGWMQREIGFGGSGVVSAERTINDQGIALSGKRGPPCWNTWRGSNAEGGCLHPG